MARWELTGASIEDARDVIAALEICPPVEELGRFVTNLASEKYDDLIPEEMLRRFWARRNEHLAEEITSLIKQLSDDDR